MDVARAESRPDDRWIGERFDDEGISGRTLDRPALTRLRHRAREGAIDRVYCMALDRLSRSLTDTSVLFDEFDRVGVDVRVVHLPELNNRPESRLLRHIVASFAQFEREMIASRIAETRTYLKQHGRRLAGPAPYGYDADPVTKQLVLNRVEARRVRAIFKRAANGQKPAEISRRIDHLGWRTKKWKSKRSGKVIGGGRWTARQVLSVLRNPVYLGEFADRSSTRPGCHEPIVDREVFQAVQRWLDDRRPRSRRSRQESNFPLRCKIECPGCRRPLCTYTVTHRKGKTTIGYRYYRCRSTAGGRAPCRGIQLPAGEVEFAAREALTDAAAWQSMIDAGASFPTASSDLLAAVWAGFDVPTQDELLSQIVGSIKISRRKAEMRITFADGFTTALEGLFQGIEADDG